MTAKPSGLLQGRVRSSDQGVQVFAPAGRRHPERIDEEPNALVDRHREDVDDILQRHWDLGSRERHRRRPIDLVQLRLGRLTRIALDEVLADQALGEDLAGGALVNGPTGGQR